MSRADLVRSRAVVIVVGELAMMRGCAVASGYLGITNALALLRLLPGSDRDKDVEILALRDQLAVLQRQPAGVDWFASASANVAVSAVS